MNALFQHSGCVFMSNTLFKTYVNFGMRRGNKKNTGPFDSRLILNIYVKVLIFTTKNTRSKSNTRTYLNICLQPMTDIRIYQVPYTRAINIYPIFLPLFSVLLKIVDSLLFYKAVRQDMVTL